MNNLLRKHIVKVVKKKDGWYDGEATQDKLIEEYCKELGYELSDFYNEDGKFINKILK